MMLGKPKLTNSIGGSEGNRVGINSSLAWVFPSVVTKFGSNFNLIKTQKQVFTSKTETDVTY